jgi:hypothetical protein
MQYALLIYETQDDFANRVDAEKSADYWAGWTAYSEAIGSVNTGGAALQGPETATSVSVRGDERLVQDGPFADAKEQLGGLFIIDVDDLDAALEWAARAPNAASSTVEVRPLLQMG